MIKSFSGGSGTGGFRLQLADVKNVELLGYDGQLSFKFVDEGLFINGLPAERPVKYAHCFKTSTT